MTPEQLKTSILQRAMQGKLVEHYDEEGLAKDLLEKILAEKAQLIADKTIKEDATEPITEDDIPFDIPENWCWARLNDLVIKNVKRGKSPTYVDKSGTQVFAQKCNVKTGGIDMSLALFLDEKKLEKYPDTEFMLDKDIVINSTGGGTMGRVGIFSDTDRVENMPIVPDSHVTVVRANRNIDAMYLYYVLKSYQKYLETMGEGSTNQTELKPVVIMNLLVPLPPFGEQKRITERISEMLPYIDRYAEAYKKLENFNAKFPDDMQKSILQYAMQGKLVEQRLEEGTAEELLKQIAAEKKHLIDAGKIPKERKLAEISEEEKEFDLPVGWKYVRVQDVATYITDYVANGSFATLRQHTKTYKSKNYALFVRTMDLTADFNGELSYIDKDSYDFLEKSKLYGGELILPNIGGSIGKAFIMPDLGMPMSLAPNSIMLKFTDPILNKFFGYLIQSPYGSKLLSDTKGGTATPKFSKTELRNMVFMLPPIKEVHRIVEAIESYIPYCDRLRIGM